MLKTFVLLNIFMQAFNTFLLRSIEVYMLLDLRLTDDSRIGQ